MPETLTQYQSGLRTLKQSLARALIENLRPPPKLSLSQWSERYAVLSAETSAQTGRFRAYPYQTGIMDAVTDPTIERISVMKSARVGYTKILDHLIGYYIHQDPSPILIVQPRVEDAEDYSQTEIDPMLRDIPVLADIAGDRKAKQANQKILKKTFRNGSSITFRGANSAGGFRRITARIVAFDEVDGYPVSGADDEGDQIALGIKRTESFWNRRIVLGSTPTIKGESRIEKSFAQSDQRYFFVPCPHCGEMQPLEWGGVDKPHGIKWDKDESGAGKPDTAHYVCRASGCIIDETDKPDMLERGEWRATKPFNGHAGFHIWAGYSLNVNASWKKLAAEWLNVKNDPLQRQTFINLVLGEPYEDLGDKAINEHKLLARRQTWDDAIPFGVVLLTAGLDVQDDRIECELVGWGRDEESWSLDYQVFEGDPGRPEIWQKVDEYLLGKWHRGDGREFRIMAACVDSGYHTQQVYNFAKARIGRKIYATKGESARNGQRSPVWPTKRPQQRNKSSYRPIILGVNTAKDVIRNRLHIEKAGPGCMHFPTDRDVNYFAQLTSERSVAKLVNGFRFRIWEKPSGRANEALDCRVYAYAALCSLQHYGLQLNRLADKTSGRPEPAEVAPAVAQPNPNFDPPAQPPPPKRKGSLASRLA